MFSIFDTYCSILYVIYLPTLAQFYYLFFTIISIFKYLRLKVQYFLNLRLNVLYLGYHQCFSILCTCGLMFTSNMAQKADSTTFNKLLYKNINSNKNKYSVKFGLNMVINLEIAGYNKFSFIE